MNLWLFQPIVKVIEKSTWVFMQKKIRHTYKHTFSSSSVTMMPASCPQKRYLRLYISQTLILNLWPDPDLARDLQIQIETDDRKRLVTSFRLPSRPCRCGYWFSSYRLGTLNAHPPPASGGWRNTPAAAGSTLKNIVPHPLGCISLPLAVSYKKKIGEV